MTADLTTVSDKTFVNYHLSVSRMRLYAECPRKFYHRYVVKTPPEDQILEEETPAVFGTAIHHSLEAFYTWIVENGYAGPFPEDRIVPTWQKSFFESKLIHPAMYREGLRILRLFGQRHPKVNHETVLGVEKEIDLRFSEFKVTGYIDRIEKVSEEEVEIVDYKSNMRPYTGEELESDIQMSTYGIAGYEMFPWAKKITFVFDMVRLGYTQRTTRTASELSDARDYLTLLGRKTERDQEWKPTLNKNCLYCEYRNHCDAYKSALAKMHPKVSSKDGLDAVAKEYAHVSYVANAAYARKRELEVILKNEVALSWDPPRLDGKVWDLLVTPQTKYDMEKLVRIGTEYKVGKDLFLELFRRGSISKEEVKEWLESAETKLDTSTYLLLKKEIEVLGLTPTTPKVSLKSKVIG